MGMRAGAKTPQKMMEPMPLLVQMSVLKKREQELQDEIHANQITQHMIVDLMMGAARDTKYGLN